MRAEHRRIQGDHQSASEGGIWRFNPPDPAAQRLRSTFLVAAQNNHDLLDVSLVSLAGGAPTVQSWDWPCSLLADGFDPFPAEAVPFGDGFLVATSNVFSDGQPGCPKTSPTTIRRVRAGESPVFVADLDTLAAAVAPHPEGLWMVGADVASAAPRLEILRLDGETGAVVVKTFADVDVGSVAVAAMGRSLALVWTSKVMSQEAPPPEIHLRVITESGDTVGEAVLPYLDTPWRVSVVASPDARSFVVAWGQWLTAGRISMARADCVGGS